IVVADAENVTDAQENILSRQKRYLIFPQGSNVQLVYCLTIGAFAPSPDQIVVGMTAALAWELPSQVDKKITKLLHRRTRSLVFPKIEAFLQSVSELSTLHLRTRLLTLLLLFTEGTFNNSTSLLKFFILSLQFLIYCLTIGTYAKPESFFTVGVTAGLAWELPHRDTVPYRKPAEVYHRRSRRELYPKVESILTTNDYLCVEIRAWMQESSLKEVDCNPVDLISNRHYTIDDCKQLYIPIESFSHPLQGFQAKKRGKDGKACVLKALCQAARRNDSDVGKGTFMQEILFSIFT
ncbi:GSCOCG00006561001-RA-CDS, partial [Cotesia congregata]